MKDDDDDWDEQFGHGGRKGGGNKVDAVIIDSNVLLQCRGFMVNRRRGRREDRSRSSSRRYEEGKGGKVAA